MAVGSGATTEWRAWAPIFRETWSPWRIRNAKVNRNRRRAGQSAAFRCFVGMPINFDAVGPRNQAGALDSGISRARAAGLTNVVAGPELHGK